MQIGIEKTKYKHNKRPQREVMPQPEEKANTESEISHPITDESPDDGIEENSGEDILKKLNLRDGFGKVEHDYKYAHNQEALQSKEVHKMFGKFGLYAGIMSFINGAGNACRSIPANPYLIGLGVILTVSSLAYLIWTFPR
ncbi:MAG: hypothetical protein EP297_01625 [Gammaproteobacteria bacterium]|nr:MAG: hypothetical protein EP297_01625 [Gammaproteobacteria bacterium]